MEYAKQAQLLARHQKGDMVGVMGKASLNIWTNREGKEREDLQVIADSIISARSVRPTGGRKKTTKPTTQGPTEPPETGESDYAGFDDEIPF